MAKKATVEAQTIYRGQDFYVPHFEVQVGGYKLPKDVLRDVTQVTYRDNIEEIDSFEIVVFNEWLHEKRAFKYSDSDIFNPGQMLELKMGYYNQNGGLRLMIKGQITSLRPSFPASGISTMTVSGLNMLHALRKKQVSDTYKKMTDSEIAKRIGRRLGIKMDIKPQENETQHNYQFQDNRYDIVFLLERARQNGYELFITESDKDGSVLFFGISEAPRVTAYKLNYGSSLIQFQPNLTTARQVSKVTVRGWDAKNKKPITATVSRSQLDTRSAKDPIDQAMIAKAVEDREEVITDQPVHSEQEAKQIAKRTLEHIAKDTVTASGSTVGLPDLRAGSILEISGLGRRFSGRYFVKATTHTIGESGYTTQFECRLEEKK